MTKKCVQCGKSFTLTDSEIKFYKSKKLNIPKRCKACREQNKASRSSSHIPKKTSDYKSYYVKPSDSRSLASVIVAVTATIIAGLLKAEQPLTIAMTGIAIFTAFKYIAGLFTGKVFIQEFDTSSYKYTFYDTKAMVKHYVKHGKQTDCDSMEDYLFKANKVITDKNSLTKKQKKDNDTIFYNKRTNEFVVVAKAGYVRTYFIASDKYYNKQ